MNAPPQEDDAKASLGSPVIKAAAALTALAGLFTGMTGLQVVIASDWYSSWWIHALPYVQLASGVASIVLASFVYRARTWSAIAGAVTSIVSLVAMSLYLVASLYWGVFSCVPIIAIGFWLLASALSLVSIPAARKATAARERMRALGEDLGL